MAVDRPESRRAGRTALAGKQAQHVNPAAPALVAAISEAQGTRSRKKISSNRLVRPCCLRAVRRPGLLRSGCFMRATSLPEIAGGMAGRVLGGKLDSIPFSPYHALIVAVLGFVGFVEGYDLAMTGSLLVLAKKPLHLTPADIRFLAVASTIMMCVGGFIASAISDHCSRKT